MKRSDFLKILGIGSLSISTAPIIFTDIEKNNNEPDIIHVKDIFKLRGGDRHTWIRFEDGHDIQITDDMIHHIETSKEQFGRALSLITKNKRYFTIR